MITMPKHKAFLLLFVACSLGVDRTPSAQEAQLADWKQIERQAETLQRINGQFEKSHQYKDLPIHTVTAALKKEGFQCRAGYMNLPNATAGQISVKAVPIVSCSKKHIQLGPDDICKVFLATFEVAFSSRKPHIKPDANFDNGQVKDQTYFCRASDLDVE
jgi:hypothetical protein